MRKLEQHTIFLREHITLPEGIALAGHTFEKVWSDSLQRILKM
jgi:hypothetical protein